MQHRIFFICPSDRLEPYINKRYRGVKHYYVSLGNSVNFNYKVVGLVKRLILKHNIKEIYFVLANDNPILLDALGNQEHSEITNLADFYKDVTTRHRYPMVLWHTNKNQVPVAVSHLKNKIKELEQELSCLFARDIKIEGEIFNKADRNFQNIGSNDLIWKESFSLN